MNANKKVKIRVNQLIRWYGDGTNGDSPTRSQWQYIVDRPDKTPVTLINFFKLRGRAVYKQNPPGINDPGTGQDAFDRYAKISIPTLAKVGGKFLLVAPFEGMFLGPDEDWDLVAIGSYPDSTSLLALFENADYRAVFFHRTAACERQKVIVCSG